MLDNLPLRVLELIVLKLDNKDIFNFAKSSPQLEAIVKQRFLYEILDLTTGYRKKQYLLKKLDSPEKRLFIKRILLNSSKFSKELMESLPTKFSNIQEMENRSKNDDLAENVLIQWNTSPKQYTSQTI